MAVNVRQLYRSVEKNDIKLLAGESGLSRVVRWVHMVENVEIASFLEGGEIAFTTGVGMEREEDLLEIVKVVAANGGSGIVINIGPYIENISSVIVDFCEKRQLPLFSVPWQVHMAEIMKRFCLMITLEDKKQLEMTSAVKNAILFPEQTDLYVPHLENYGLHVNDSYIVMLIQIAKEEGEDQEIYERVLIRQIENCVVQMEWNCTVVGIEGYVLLLFAGKDCLEEVLEDYSKKLLENCMQLRRRKKIEIGVGQATKNMYCIARSFRQAKSVLDLAHMNVQDTIFYSRLGLYKLLFGISDKEVIRNYVQETLGKILDYDKMNHNNLTEVLRVYLKHNGSVKDTAEEMYVHRNTINYKVHRIGEILGCSLMDYEVCARINVALKLYDIMYQEIGRL